MSRLEACVIVVAFAALGLALAAVLLAAIWGGGRR